MKYLCLVYVDQPLLAHFTKADDDKLTHDSIAYDEELEASGLYILSHALQPTSAARTVRMRKGKRATTDGPFAETREHLAGFILIEAASMDEAVDAAAGIPLAQYGSIEVRPVMELTDPGA